MKVRLRNTLNAFIVRAISALREDRGDESVNKILWAGAIVAIVTIVGGIFRDTLVTAFNSLVITLGFSDGP